MRKLIFAAAMLTVSGLAGAQYVGPSGSAAAGGHPVLPANHPLLTNSGDNMPAPGNHPVLPANHPLLTVAGIHQQGKDDMRVSVEGHIVRHVRDEYYMFSDGTGEMLVDIDSEYFPAGKPIDAKTKVRLSGKLDIDKGEPVELDVKRLEILP